jgi:selenophosphate synthase
LTNDPQTSGGLLLAVDPKHSDSIIESLRPAFPAAVRIGVVEPTANHTVSFVD